MSGKHDGYQAVLPMEIEKRSFAIIGEELDAAGIVLDEAHAAVIKRVIHTTADFEYAETMTFSDGVLETIKAAIRGGAVIVTDTTMALSGINKKALEKCGAKAVNFIKDEDVAALAKAQGCTRSAACMDKAAGLKKPVIFVIGNAPTALLRICELMEAGSLSPVAVIGVPVGFVNVVFAKEKIIQSGVPHIVARGRKGGSNVAAAIVNAILYEMDQTRGE